MSLDQLYSQQIKAWAQIGGQDHRLDPCDASLELRNPTCGSKVVATIIAGPPLKIGLDARRACLLTQATAQALILGPSESTKKGQDLLEAILSGQDMCSKETDWQHLEAFAPVAPFRARHASILLPFKAVGQLLASL